MELVTNLWNRLLPETQANVVGGVIAGIILLIVGGVIAVGRNSLIAALRRGRNKTTPSPQAPAPEIVVKVEQQTPPTSKPATPPRIRTGPRRSNVAHYIKRGPEEQIVAQLKRGDGAAIVGLTAPGGLGKTTLAEQVCAQLKSTYDPIIWIDFGENLEEQIVRSLTLKLGLPVTPNAGLTEQIETICNYLAGKRHLLVFDDVRSVNQILLNWLNPPCAVLITSRIQVAADYMSSAQIHRVDPLTETQARELLAGILGETMLTAEPEATTQ